jgi:phosphate transport system ATP-binding protein
MSIYDNVAYGPRIHGTRGRKRLDQIVEEHLKMAGLWEEVKSRLGSPASGLSIGQQQRLCLARGLAVEPEIILADESTSALDPISAETIERRFMELKQKYTIVMVTHILRQARRLADYVIFLYMGRLIEHGPAEEFFNRPKYAKTQAYLSGRFIEEHKIDRELDLKWTSVIENMRLVHSEFGNIQAGQILRVTVDRDEAVAKLSQGIEAEGHRILEAKRVGKQSWEVVAEKKKS